MPPALTAAASVAFLAGAYWSRRDLLRAPGGTVHASRMRLAPETRSTFRLASIWTLACLAAWSASAAVRAAGIGAMLGAASLPAAILAITPPKLLVDCERP
jgi:hypothetical protein